MFGPPFVAENSPVEYKSNYSLTQLFFKYGSSNLFRVFFSRCFNGLIFDFLSLFLKFKTRSSKIGLT